MKSLLKKVLSESQFASLRDAQIFYKTSKANQLISSGQSAGLKFASQVKPMASAYYSLLSRQFQREERAVLSGLAKYKADLKEDDANVFLMRRNVHRLEKGLTMRPRRSVFGRDYILETVNVYRKIVAEPSRSMETTGDSLNWAFDVLTAYFRASAVDPVVDHAREVFRSCMPPDGSCAGGGRRVPYKRILDEHPVEYDQLKKLAIKRRSVRWFEQRTVPRDLLDKAFTVAGLSPSACNRQPFRFLVFDDPETVAEVASLPGGTSGFKHNIPVMVVVLGTLDAFYDEKDRHVPYIDVSLAAMSFALALETLGLGSCIFNWPDVERHEIRAEKVLGLKPYERPVFFMGVGYPEPEATVAYSQKRPLEVIREYNRPISKG